MTYDEIMDKWGDVPCKFDHYCKYAFYYKGVAEDDYTIVAGYKVSATHIYHYEVSSDEELFLGDTLPDSISITKNGEDVAYWDSY